MLLQHIANVRLPPSQLSCSAAKAREALLRLSSKQTPPERTALSKNCPPYAFQRPSDGCLLLLAHGGCREDTSQQQYVQAEVRPAVRCSMLNQRIVAARFLRDHAYVNRAL